jgi:hypothetical protein
MVIKVRPSEQVILDAIAVDSNELNLNGVQIQPTTPYAATAFPIENYAATLADNPGISTKVLDGSRGFLAPLFRRISPLFAQVTNNVPSFTITTPQTLLTMILPESLEVSRVAEVSVQGTASSSSSGSRLGFWVEVNGIPYTTLGLPFAQASVNKTFAGSWIVNLPVGAVTITLRAEENISAHTISIGANDFVNMTLRS